MKKILSITNKLILVLLAFLGFSCDSDDPGVEYGMPSADFKLTGNIIDKVTEANLNNIQVIFSDAASSTYNFDTTYSDVNGNYEVNVNAWPTSTAFMVQINDPDGAENGKYLAIDTIVDFSDIEFVDGDGAWNSGEKLKELNLKLSPDETL